MNLMSWLPRALKELITHVPTLLFEVVSWTELSKDISALSQRLITGSGAAELRQKLTKSLPKSLNFTDQSSPLVRSNQLGEMILELYFRQLKNKDGMFLDLRLRHFSGSENRFMWNPNSMWTCFSPAFREALQKLYDGFYLGSDQVFHDGLVETGLISQDWSVEDQLEMKRLFKAHFGSAIDQPMEFKLASFQESFQNVFSFLMKKKVKLSTDFLILGVMLVTLYLSLEELGGSYPVADIYKKSKLSYD